MIYVVASQPRAMKLTTESVERVEFLGLVVDWTEFIVANAISLTRLADI